jgi:hypothetical protein
MDRQLVKLGRHGRVKCDDPVTQAATAVTLRVAARGKTRHTYSTTTKPVHRGSRTGRDETPGRHARADVGVCYFGDRSWQRARWCEPGWTRLALRGGGYKTADKAVTGSLGPAADGPRNVAGRVNPNGTATGANSALDSVHRSWKLPFGRHRGGDLVRVRRFAPRALRRSRCPRAGAGRPRSGVYAARPSKKSMSSRWSWQTSIRWPSCALVSM